MSKKRKPIPPETAARILFLSDRTCCVCRTRGKPVQIHHIDENPSNNNLHNLSVLCFDCHRDTQIRGGFDRKLDSDQIILYREDWHKCVARQRTLHAEYNNDIVNDNNQYIELVTSIAEIYRDKEEYELLAMHYHSIGNFELRDKYIEIVLQDNLSDQTVCYLRFLQEKPELIPEEVIQRELSRYEKSRDWLQRARFYTGLRRYHNAISDYVLGVHESLQENNEFSAAYYLKELVEEGLIEELFIIALKHAREEGDLWWQVRALQELGWQKELDDLMILHSEEIDEAGDGMLSALLAKAKGNSEEYKELRKSLARDMHITFIADDDNSNKADDN